MNNITRHRVQGYPVWHITDAYQADTVKRWLDWYQNSGIRWGWHEQVGEPQLSEPYKQAMLMTPQEHTEVFGENPYIPEWNAEHQTDIQHEHRARIHVNLVTEGTQFVGHTDIPTSDTRNILIALWFGTPCWDNPGGGFELGEGAELHIPNQFNSMLMFPAQLWHRIPLFKGSEIRVTVYASYLEHNTKGIRSWQDMRNCFDTDPVRQRQIAQHSLRTYGVNLPRLSKPKQYPESK